VENKRQNKNKTQRPQRRQRRFERFDLKVNQILRQSSRKVNF
jgi:hypothetical protein